MPAFLIKAVISDLRAERYDFTAQKTMYGGKAVMPGDTIYLFASENQGGRGLFARGIVAAVETIPLKPGLARQTPRVNLSIRPIEFARRPLGRDELKPFNDWGDGRPQTELNFKFYRQATNKVGSISEAAAAFLETHF